MFQDRTRSSLLRGLASDLLEKNALILDAGCEEVLKLIVFGFCYIIAFSFVENLRYMKSLLYKEIHFVKFAVFLVAPGCAKEPRSTFQINSNGVARQKPRESHNVHERNTHNS